MWNKLPTTVVAEIKRRLGDDGFYKLDALALKYNIFKQRFFEGMDSLKGDIVLYVEMFGHFLSSMGNQLAEHGHMADAELAFRLSIKLKPDQNPSHASLAFLLFKDRRYHEAAQQARAALAVLEEFDRQVAELETPPPEDVVPPGGSAELSAALREIILNVEKGNS